jgi:hypothetical protein
MTAKKSNPSKRGRKELTRGVREAVYLRFRSFFRDERERAPKRLTRQIADDFVAKNQAWFKEIEIAIGNYPTLRNVLVAGRNERATRRRQNWGIVTNIGGKKYFSANGRYLRHVQMVALGIIPN